MFIYREKAELKEFNHKEWSGKTDGQPWMHRFLISWLKIFNLQSLYFFMSLVIPFYMIFNRKGYLSIYRYFRERHKYGITKSFINVYKNHYTFGKVILDRFAVFAGKKFSIEFTNLELFKNLCNSPKGVMILSSHVGNYELAGYSLSPENKKFYAVGYLGENETILKNKIASLERNGIYMIPVKRDMSHLFLLNDAIKSGDIVSIPADRLFGSPKFIWSTLLGKRAKFPMGPFKIAVQKDIPAIAIFVMKEGTTKYRVIVEDLTIESDSLNRNEALSSLADNFAKKLEKILVKYPEQWFNYYEFWEGE